MVHCLTWPTHGAQRVSNDPLLTSVEIWPSGMCGAWLRHSLETRYKRSMRLERESRNNPQSHLYEPLPAIEDIEHRNSKDRCIDINNRDKWSHMARSSLSCNKVGCIHLGRQDL